MSGNIYALLVGINKYHEDSPVTNLSGCVNDVRRYDQFLKDNYDNYRPIILEDGAATRNNVINNFLSHLGQAGPEDVALFIYAGHGAQSFSAPEFKKYFPDGLDEGLVCHDSRLKGHYDLADKELAVLLNKVAAKNPHIAVILDACHSGSGTRDIDEMGGLMPRYTDPRGMDEARTLESYLEGSPEEGFYMKMMAQAGSNGRLIIPSSRHVLLAACEPEQTAKEDRLTKHGIFSDTALDILERRRGEISYADLFTQCRAKVKTRARNQDPQFDVYNKFNAGDGFLGRAIPKSATRYYDVSFNGESESWEINVGAIEGISTDADKTVTLALYPAEGSKAKTLGDAVTTKVGAVSSEVEMPENLSGDRETRYKARITSMPVAPLLVQFKWEGEDKNEGEKWLNQLNEATDPKLKSKYTELFNLVFTTEEGNTKYLLEKKGPDLVLKQRETGKILETYEDYDNRTEDAKSDPYRIFQHIGRWERLLALQNKRTAMDKSSLEFVYETPTGGGRTFKNSEGEEITLDYSGEQIPGEFKIRNLTHTKQDLYYMLLYFSEDYGIMDLTSGVIKPSSDFTTIFGEEDDLQIDDDEIDEMHVTLRLFVTTEEVDPFLLTQKDLEEVKELLRSGDRSPFAKKDKFKKFENEWFIKTFRVKLVRQVDKVGAKDAELVGGKITIKAHPSLNGNINMSRSADPTRSLNAGPDVTSFLQSHGMQTIGLSAEGARDVGAPNSIEISNLPLDVNDQLAENPLEIELKAAQLGIGEGETVMPLVFDGEHWLVGGDVLADENDPSKMIVSVEHVPDARDTRSLGKALKLYFLKTYVNEGPLQYFLKGKTVPLNKLRLVEFKEDGSVDRLNDHGKIRTGIKNGNNVLLLIHGIIGDTENIAEGMGLPIDEAGKRIADHFDVILSYDYENLSTNIADTAKKLKEDLDKIAGLNADSGKNLTILAHSMGGLVSRHFVEQLGGNEMVGHLVMCGTPNNGSPFGEVAMARNVLSVVTTLALNVVPGMAAVGPIISGILQRSKKLTPTLEQMSSDSDFLKTLNGSIDPKTRYTILGGDVEKYKNESDQFFERLLEKTGKSFIFDLLYGDSPHDIAVSKNSIQSVSLQRDPSPTLIDVDCHHMNYFVAGPGLEALKQVKW